MQTASDHVYKQIPTINSKLSLNTADTWVGIQETMSSNINIHMKGHGESSTTDILFFQCNAQSHHKDTITGPHHVVI